VGQGKENGQIDVCDPNFGKKFTPTPGSEEKHPANSARNGDGIRVEPGYVMYFPAGVPHSMLDTEKGNKWYNTAQPIGSFTDATLGRSNKVYQASKEPPL